MKIDWCAVASDTDYLSLKKSKDNLYDYIIGELNRISVSEDLEEKANLLSYLKHNIDIYYDKCVECTKILLKYSEE